MTQEQFDKALELTERRDYYKNLLEKVDYSQKKKERLDREAEEYLKNNRTDPNPHKQRWQLAQYFRVRFWNKEAEPTIGVMPHWEFAREINIKAEPELIDLIREWLEKKVKEYESQIESI